MTPSSSSSSNSIFALAHRSELALSAALLGVIGIVLVPLPPVILDLLLSFNLAITILLLLITLNVKHPLEISVFPSLLLLMTLYRLSLNVGTTRQILLEGDAGKLISTFGGFVVGGNLVVGLVIFLILIIIQFIVITKGATRVSEVSARFTLDALPGKQMAIDAELSAGFIDEKQARERRQHLMRETEFYGAMDGASKFVRGDAIAGLVVTAVNLLGGIIIGMGNNLSLLEAVRRYSVLTVGDGLISQIPALIIATASGVLVTKAASKMSLSQEIESQVLFNTRPLITGAVILVVLALVPGLPKLPFLAMAGVIVFFVRRSKNTSAEETKPEPAEVAPPRSPNEQLLDDFVQTDRACVEVGARLITLVESNHARGLADRIPSLRRELTQQHGMWIPTIRIRDNLQLGSETYRILINGREVARGELQADKCLAIHAEGVQLNTDGDPTTDPTFGLPASWIHPANQRRAELAGHTVVDAAGVLVTHLGEVLRRYAHELLSREDLQQLLDRLKETAPTIVNELKPDILRVSTLHNVLIQLLEERVPITDLERILECLLSHATRTKDENVLAQRVREDLGRSICDRFRDEEGRVRVMVVTPRLEAALRESMQNGEIAINAVALDRLINALNTQVQSAELSQAPVAVLTDTSIRRALRRTVQRSLADLAIISYTEIPQDLMIDPVRMLDLNDVFDAGSSDASMSSVTTEEVAFSAA